MFSASWKGTAEKRNIQGRQKVLEGDTDTDTDTWFTVTTNVTPSTCSHTHTHTHTHTRTHTHTHTHTHTPRTHASARRPIIYLLLDYFLLLVVGP